MQTTQPITHDLHVVTMISNPRRFKRRYDLYKMFRKHMQDSGVQLTTVEVTHGDRLEEIADENTIVLNTTSEIWHKENALNIGVSRLPSDWKYIAWIDADIQFARPDWAMETIHMLQHHPVVQPWSTAYDLYPNYETFNLPAKSYGWCYQNMISPYPKMPLHDAETLTHTFKKKSGEYIETKKQIYWHSGYAWACTREAFDALGGLIDFAILGSADRYMADGLTGDILKCVPKNVHKEYKEDLLIWQDRAEKYIKRDLGFVDGTINHYWHGKKVNRKYKDRNQILIDNKFNPRTDLKRDYQGLLQLVDSKPKLRDDLRHYFQQRNEDGIDI